MALLFGYLDNLRIARAAGSQHLLQLNQIRLCERLVHPQAVNGNMVLMESKKRQGLGLESLHGFRWKNAKQIKFTSRVS